MAAALRPGGWLLVEDAATALQPLACLDDSVTVALAIALRSGRSPARGGEARDAPALAGAVVEA